MIIWKSELTSEMLGDLTLSEFDLQDLQDQLNDAVQTICESFGIQ
jgi:hypothetical protein